MDLQGVDVGAAYRGVRERILDLVADLSAEQWETVTPHCPAWTIRQTISHLAGIVDDGINNNMDGVATEAWTAAHVDKRSLLSGPDIATEWATWAPFVDARATERGLDMSQLVFDAVTHEHDLRHALGMPGARDSVAVSVGVWFATRKIPQRLAAKGIGLQLVVDGVSLLNDTRADLQPLSFHGSAFDVLRMSGSRRTAPQIYSLNWDGDPAPFIAELPFALPVEPISE